MCLLDPLHSIVVACKGSLRRGSIAPGDRYPHWQGLDDEAVDQLVVVVRPSAHFGVSLWGESGDAEEVEVVFCVAPETGRVSASNQCT
jgi:hypothetical protein